jgi:hypothetical protein
LAATSRQRWSLERLLPDVRSIPAIEETVPKSVPTADRKRWVDDQRKADEEAALARIDGTIRLDSELTVDVDGGKLSFMIDEQEAARVFVTADQSALVAAQWRSVALDFQPRGKDDAKRLVDRLRLLATEAEPAVEQQIIAIGDELATLGRVIADDERDLHELTCRLFALTPEERRLVEAGRGNA